MISEVLPSLCPTYFQRIIDCILVWRLQLSYLDDLPRYLWQLKHLLALRFHLGADACQLMEGLSLAEYPLEGLQNGILEYV